MNLLPRRIFFGWWIVAASFLVAMYASGVITYGFTTVIEPVSLEMGWSYTQISLAASLRGFEAGLLSPLAGLLVDRWGPRRVISTGAVITSTGFFLLSRTQSLGMFYIAFVLMAMGTSVFMTVLMTVVASWFRKRMGLASGIAVCGFGAGGLVVPLVAGLVDSNGWRETMSILSVSALVILLPLSLVFRHKPEQYGYLPDGAQTKGEAILDKSAVRKQASDADFRAKQALRSSTFWRITLAIMCINIVLGAVSTHVMPYLSSIGIARSVSSFVAGAIPLMSIGGRLGFGWLGDRFDKRRMLMLALAMAGTGLLAFGFSATAGALMLVLFVILYGIGFGGGISLRPQMVREYFGTANFGTIFGFLMGVNAAGAMIGPPLAGWVYDTQGAYQGIWFGFAGLFAAAVISIWTVPSARAI
ncbi:MAG: MFS transporter [Chloroflexi bacterium]|nr:MFS transporter [Chloroflexota bacterium]